MTSAEIRQSFLDFFESKKHAIVPSSSLMPDSPNLLFTNAGMNQFVPIFLGQTACPYVFGRAADTQKCIRAGGKHNDLEDVGLDTYHHTFFEMLGNWSFGDYFKQEAIEWAWELLTEVWKLPRERLYATVYRPGAGEPADFDQEAYEHWEGVFTRAGLDPKVHIRDGGKADNFWMMGETGPCGPCSEIHMDLTPQGDTGGALVNAGSPDCIEIWNLVFIQFNANPDGSFSPLPARHVDTGMGFERVAAVIQTTNGFTDFSRTMSNYDTDIFRPVFEKLEKLSGKKYGATLSKSADGATPQERIDIAFRVIGDHIRTLGFAIADGIQPGNTDRNYVLRRILRRAVRYGRTLGFHEPFFYQLVEVLAETMGDAFPEIREKSEQVRNVIRTEEEAFNRTLDEGIRIFEEFVSLKAWGREFRNAVKARFAELRELENGADLEMEDSVLRALNRAAALFLEKGENVDRQFLSSLFQTAVIKQLGTTARELVHEMQAVEAAKPGIAVPLAAKAAAKRFEKAFQKFLKINREYDGKLNGSAVFLLYDTYGFPVDLTELMARERGLELDHVGFEELMEAQRARARAAQKKQVISLSEIEIKIPTEFNGYQSLETTSNVLEVVEFKEKTAVILDVSPFYPEMGGQVGDTGDLVCNEDRWRVTDTQKTGETWLHFVDRDMPPPTGEKAILSVDARRRRAIQRHHTVTHLLHWAIHEVVSPDATQKGSYVGPDKLTFDFNSSAVKSGQLEDIERLVNERILENSGVSDTQLPFDDVKERKEITQIFGEKYGDSVRIVQIGGTPRALDGFSMELCGGTHTLATGEIGQFRIVAESAIAAGIRRIEAVAGERAYERSRAETALISTLSGKVNSPVGELEKKIENLLAQQKELEKALKSAQQKEAVHVAQGLLNRQAKVNGVDAVVWNLGKADGNFLQAAADALKSEFQGVVVLGGVSHGAVSLVATVSKDLTKRFQAGRIIQAIAPIVGGKGGGRPDNARGGGKDADQLDAALNEVKALLAR